MPIAYVALALAVIAFVLWLTGLSKAKASSARVASLLVENASLQEQVKSLSADHKKSTKLLAERSEELTEIKKEIGALKKKNFALQEDAKKNKSSFEAKLEEREKQLVARPAFEHMDEPKGKKAEGRAPKADDRGPSADGRKPIADDRLAMAESRAPMADERSQGGLTASADAETSRKLESLTKDNADLAGRLAKLESELRDAVGDQRRMKKKMDDYRRADTVAKSRLELLNDKLGSMGRQYYDAISELAALKGESAPPAPRAPAEKVPEASGDEPAPAANDEDDVHSLSQELVGVLQQRDNRSN